MKKSDSLFNKKKKIFILFEITIIVIVIISSSAENPEKKIEIFSLLPRENSYVSCVSNSWGLLYV